jgi:hypothetical protein
MTQCQNCGADIHNDKNNKGMVYKGYTICLECKYVFKIDRPGKIKIYEQQPLDQMPTIDPTFRSRFEIDEIVACSDPRHPLFLEFGKIVKIEHIHIRVEFFNGKTIWMSDQIIEKVPEEWTD